jgi:hypothetical protein
VARRPGPLGPGPCFAPLHVLVLGLGACRLGIGAWAMADRETEASTCGDAFSW